MTVSLVTVCRNAAGTIGDALASVAAQRLPPGLALEHVVVDGASTDGTAACLRAFAAALDPARRDFAFRWRSEPDGGMYDALNKGIRLATGDVVGVLNADDWLDGDDVVARVAAFFAQAGEALDCAYGNVRFAAGPGGRTRRVCFARLWRPWMLQWGYMPPHPGVFVRRRCYAAWGGYVPDSAAYRIAADYELLVRFFRVRRMRARYMPVCTTAMRPGGASTRDVAARRRLNAEIVRANRENGYFCCWPMLLPKYAVKVWEILLPRLGLLDAGKGVDSCTKR